MLVKLYRIGPSRQRLRKGWVVVAPHFQFLTRPEHLPKFPDNLTLRVPPGPHELATPVWLDTGLRWLHSYEARETCFQALQEATRLLAAWLEQQGAQLYPAAVAPREGIPWARLCCEDEHALEVYDDIEREVIHNHIRQESDLLIAISGRSRSGMAGVQPAGSVRLEQSGFSASPYLSCCEPAYLDRVLAHLKRHRGVSDLASLDLQLRQEQGEPLPQLRIHLTDAQTLLSTSRVHSILYQALLLQGRRMARMGARVEGISQRTLEKNRTQTIARGVQAPLISVNGERSKSAERLERLLLSMVGELHVLGVTPEELAPLSSGAALNSLGLEGILSENELFRRHFHKASPQIPACLATLVRTQRLELGPSTDAPAAGGAEPLGAAARVTKQTGGWSSLADYNRMKNPAAYAVIMMQWEAHLQPAGAATTTHEGAAPSSASETPGAGERTSSAPQDEVPHRHGGGHGLH
ncbi:MAG: hypothetical protein ACKO6N_10360 [Myxococcota bacterium]